MPKVESRGWSISYDVVGSGPPVVLVAGLSQWREQWVDAGVVAALADRFTVVSIDPLGHGSSDKPHVASAYGSGVLDDLLAVVDHEGIPAASWWGFSRGAWMLLDLCSLHPERVRAAVFGSAILVAGPRPWPEVPPNELCRAPGGLERLWFALGFDDPEMVAVALSRNDPEALACAVEGTELSPIPDVVGTPSLSYKGSLEGYSDTMLATLERSGAEMHEVPGADHFATFASVAPVLPAIVSFLEQHT